MTATSTINVDQLIDHLLHDVAQATHLKEPDELVNTRNVIAQYPIDLLHQLATVFEDTARSYVIKVHISFGEDSTTIREALCYYPHLSTPSSYVGLILLRSLRHYTQIPKLDDYSTVDETLRQECTALMIATEIIRANLQVTERRNLLKQGSSSDGDAVLVIRNPRLVDLLMERTDDAARIANIVVARRTDNVKLIKSILDYDTSALADGIL